ncbi:MAG: hypothetical protein K1W33_07780 [Clostridia bacterium]
MLILAGVSINAIIGDDGIINRTQYSIFLSEMTEVEEAVQMWKAGEAIGQMGEETKAIPANGLCNREKLMSTERLVGEVGYYRIWSMTETVPEISVLSNAIDFNNEFEGELIAFPAGVQDLFYLNNEAIGIKSDKTYVIDAATGMIYSMSGVKLKGVSCYSANMATAVMIGTSKAPIFAESEVSGTGADDEKLAGNVQDEYLEDGTKNPDYNPYGFKLISDGSNLNVYKLYNNGLLYGKGLKGNLLNSTVSEKDILLDKTRWNELKIPQSIPGASSGNVTVVSARNCIYVVDENNELWGWGVNDMNRFGLKQSEQINYTAYKPVKLNVDGKKIYKVIPNYNATWVITITNGIYELYVAGYNQGNFGINSDNVSFENFQKVEFDNPQNIVSINSDLYSLSYATLILTKEKDVNGKNISKIWYAGNKKWSVLLNTDMYGKASHKFVQLFDGTYGDTALCPDNVDKIIQGLDAGNENNFFFISNNTLYQFNGSTVAEVLFGEQSAKILKFSASQIVGIAYIEINNEKQIWYKAIGAYNLIGASNFEANKWLRLDNDENCPSEIVNSGIKEMDMTSDYTAQMSTGYIVLNNGNVYVFGCEEGTGTGKGNKAFHLDKLTKLDDLNNIDGIVLSEESPNSHCVGSVILYSGEKDSRKYYMTWDSYLYGFENILQKSWIPVAENVKKFNGQTSASTDALAYIDKNNDIWVLGYDPSTIGLGNVETKPVKNFVRLKDYFEENSDIYKALNGKVVDYQIGFEILMILNDDGELYVSGKDTPNSNWNNTGLGVGETALEPTLLDTDVKVILGSYNERVYVKKTGEIFVFGGGQAGANRYVPTLISGIEIDKDSDVELFGNRDYGCVLLENYNYNGEEKQNVYICGMSSNDGLKFGFRDDQGGTGWRKVDTTKDFGNDPIKSYSHNYWANYILTQSNKIYGTGNLSYLGKNAIYTSFISEYTYLTDGSSIAVGYGENDANGSFAIVCNDGKVYGTGYNGNGILGRWIGINRKQANSRYKTAFEWVECPELEL